MCVLTLNAHNLKWDNKLSISVKYIGQDIEAWVQNRVVLWVSRLQTVNARSLMEIYLVTYQEVILPNMTMLKAEGV